MYNKLYLQFKNITKKFLPHSHIYAMSDFQQHIRTHFNVIHKDDYLSLTLINPNISIDIMNEIKAKFKLMSHIKKQQVIIIQTPNFDDELLTILAQSLPQSLTELSLDFTGCESIKGSGFLDLFQKISQMQNLRKLHLDLSEVYDINDFVIEGLSMLTENLANLQDFYLDLYEIDQVTEDGYLILAECISNLANVKRLHIDLSANPNLTEDALQLMFSYFPKDLTSLGFRILDIEHIGGGSFFKLAESISEMKNLSELNLTISTFVNINHKGTYSIIKAISSLANLKVLTLNLSNINLSEKTLSLFSFANCLQNLTLDLSCNPGLTDRDIICLSSKIPVQSILKSVSFNFDFCNKISEEAIETLIQKICENKSLTKLSLPDRNYSIQFVNSCVNIIDKSNCFHSMMAFTCNAVRQMTKLIGLQPLEAYKKKQKMRRNIIFASYLLRRNGNLKNFQRDILQLF